MNNSIFQSGGIVLVPKKVIGTNPFDPVIAGGGGGTRPPKDAVVFQDTHISSEITTLEVVGCFFGVVFIVALIYAKFTK